MGDTIESQKESRASKLLYCLEHGGERLKDEAIGLNKQNKALLC